MTRLLALNERQLNVNDDADNYDNDGDNDSSPVDDDVSSSNVDEVECGWHNWRNIALIQSEAGDDDEGDFDREIDKGGDVITDENEETTEYVTVTSHPQLSTVTDELTIQETILALMAAADRQSHC